MSRLFFFLVVVVVEEHSGVTCTVLGGEGGANCRQVFTVQECVFFMILIDICLFVFLCALFCFCCCCCLINGLP